MTENKEPTDDAAVDAVDFDHDKEDAGCRCPYCHAAYVPHGDSVCPAAPAMKQHSFIVMNSKTDTVCITKGCGQTRELGNHYTQEDIDKILERRRALMPDYDERLKEWLS